MSGRPRAQDATSPLLGGSGKGWSVDLSRRQMQSTVAFLGSDLLEGRAPGTRGAQLAEGYVRSLFMLWDMDPENGGDYLQPFTLKGYTVEALEAEVGGTHLRHRDDVVGDYTAAGGAFTLDAETVFVGFGITTDLWEWNDYKGVDVRDKVVVARVNDPGLYDATVFEGEVLTYFGRWTYHIEEAMRRGASGILLIHTDETAGYGWHVVRNSWEGESLYLPEQVSGNLKLRMWIREASFKEMLRGTPHRLAALYEASQRRDFQPVELGLRMRVRGRARARTLETHNVVAHIPGKSKERIVLSAHIDHLGKKQGEKGDTIYNGAIDNGTAVAAMLLVAKTLKDVQPELHYSLTVLATNAEEQGLLGAKHYVGNTDRNTIIGNINFESTPPWQKAGSVMGVGAGFSTFEDMLQAVAKEQGDAYSEFSMTDQGFFYRSDQFPFAQHNIPSVWVSAGEDDASGQRKYSTFWKTAYHTVDDEYDPEWDLGGLEQTVATTVRLIEHMNVTKTVPKWKRKLPFPTNGGSAVAPGGS